MKTAGIQIKPGMMLVPFLWVAVSYAVVSIADIFMVYRAGISMPSALRIVIFAAVYIFAAFLFGDFSEERQVKGPMKFKRKTTSVL